MKHNSNLLVTLLLLPFIVFQPTQGSEVIKPTAAVNIYDQQWQQCNHYLLRKGLFFKVVDVDWYAVNCQESQDILTASPVLLRFTYFRNIKGGFFIESATEYFLRNLSSADQKLSQNLITEFNEAYQDVQDGDIYDLAINSKGRLNLYKNKRLIQSSEHPLIRNNYLKIWFGQDPVLPALKQAFEY